MTELGGVKEALARTQALERVQEAARRQGDRQQHPFSNRLDKPAREHRVEAGEEQPDEEAADENEGDEGERKDALRPPAVEKGSDLKEEDRGRHVDARA
jgi:hypothetical protein